ncbi:MAG: DsbA family protein [Bradymonadaceae bacterium]
MERASIVVGLCVCLLATAVGCATGSSAEDGAATAYDSGWLPVAESPQRGPETGFVTIVVFNDLTCEGCGEVARKIEQVRQQHDSVRVVYKHFPSADQSDRKVAVALETARAQGKFWALYDALAGFGGQFDGQTTEEKLTRFVEKVGLDRKAFEKALDSDIGGIQSRIQDDVQLAEKLGLKAAPVAFVNGQQLAGKQQIAKLPSVVDRALRQASVLARGGVDPSMIYQTAAMLNRGQGMSTGSGDSGGSDVEGREGEGSMEAGTLKVGRGSAETGEAPAGAGPADSEKEPVGDSPVRGPADAPVTIYVFSEFQCPYCKKAKPTIEKVMEEYDGQVRLVFKHFPLPFHKHAKSAARAGIAAQKQGKFWEMHALMFENQRQLGQEGIYAKWAEQLGMDIEQFKRDMENVPESRIKDDMKMGKSVGVKGTPALFINGKRLVGAQPYEKFEAVIEEELE